MVRVRVSATRIRIIRLRLRVRISGCAFAFLGIKNVKKNDVHGIRRRKNFENTIG